MVRFAPVFDFAGAFVLAAVDLGPGFALVAVFLGAAALVFLGAAVFVALALGALAVVVFWRRACE